MDVARDHHLSQIYDCVRRPRVYHVMFISGPMGSLHPDIIGVSSGSLTDESVPL